MSWSRWIRIVGLLLLGVWAVYVIMVVSAFAGIEAAKQTEPGRGVTTIPAPQWVAPR